MTALIPKILVFAGSTRVGAYSGKVADCAQLELALQGSEVTRITLADYPLPLMSEDLEREDGIPDNAYKLARLFASHDALLICTPEYNGSLPPLLKNTIDWVSRPLPEQSGYVPFQSKAVALMSASPGALGGMRGLRHLRDVLTELQMIILPKQVSLTAAHQAFDDAGNLRDPAMAGRMQGLVVELLGMVERLG